MRDRLLAVEASGRRCGGLTCGRLIDCEEDWSLRAGARQHAAGERRQDAASPVRCRIPPQTTFELGRMQSSPASYGYHSHVGEQKRGRRITDPEEIEALRQVRERVREIPGRTEVQVFVWRKGEEPPGPGLPDSPSSTRAMTLREFRERLGGDTGHLPDRRGELHFVSIEQWANDNPDETYVKPVFFFRPDDAHAAEWLKEWQNHLSRFPPDQEMNPSSPDDVASDESDIPT